MTQHPDLFTALAAPFESHEVKARSQSGRQLHYVTARTVMNRLDNVLGPEHWWDEYVPSEHSVLCRLTIRLPDGSTLTKCDAGGYAGLEDEGDDDKSGYSDAFKRAAVKFGVARYLYRDGVPTFAQRVKAEPGDDPVEPEHRDPTPTPTPPRQERTNVNGKAHAGPPRTGKALFAWTKDREQEYQLALLKYLNGWARLQEFPARMVDWDSTQVERAYAEACRKLASASDHNGNGQAREAMRN